MNAWKGLGCVESKLQKQNSLISCEICDFETLKDSRRATKDSLPKPSDWCHRDKGLEPNKMKRIEKEKEEKHNYY